MSERGRVAVVEADTDEDVADLPGRRLRLETAGCEWQNGNEQRQRQTDSHGHHRHCAVDFVGNGSAEFSTVAVQTNVSKVKR